MRTKLIAGMVVLALVATATIVVLARDNFGTQPPVGIQPLKMAHQGSRGPWCTNQLTDEEKQEIQQQLQEFWQQMRDQYNIMCPRGPRFVDEDGDGICDNKGAGRQGYRRGFGFGWFAQTE